MKTEYVLPKIRDVKVLILNYCNFWKHQNIRTKYGIRFFLLLAYSAILCILYTTCEVLKCNNVTQVYKIWLFQIYFFETLQSARLEAQARTHQLLIHNRELLDHIAALVAHLQDGEKATSQPQSSPHVAMPQVSHTQIILLMWIYFVACLLRFVAIVIFTFLFSHNPLVNCDKYFKHDFFANTLKTR